MKKYIWIFILVFMIGVGLFLYKGTYSIEDDVSIKKRFDFGI